MCGLNPKLFCGFHRNEMDVLEAKFIYNYCFVYEVDVVKIEPIYSIEYWNIIWESDGRNVEKRIFFLLFNDFAKHWPFDVVTYEQNYYREYSVTNIWSFATDL